MYGRAHHLFIHLRCTDKQTATQLTVLGTLRLENLSWKQDTMAIQGREDDPSY